MTFCNFILKRCHNCNHKIFHRRFFILQVQNLKILKEIFEEKWIKNIFACIIQHLKATAVDQNIPLIPLFAFYSRDIAIVAYPHLHSILFANILVYFRSFQELHLLFYQTATGSRWVHFRLRWKGYYWSLWMNLTTNGKIGYYSIRDFVQLGFKYN